MWTCPNCGREFKRTNQSHFCGSAPETVEAYIAALPEDDRLALAAFACLMERGAERLYDECVDDGDARARLEQLQQAGAPSPDDGGDTPADEGADAPADDDSELPPATGISIG